MVGIPKDLVLPFALAMLTFLSGKALYPLLFNKHIASIFLASVSHFIWSTPAVRLPLLEVTFLIANALASNEVTSRCCKALTLLYLFSLWAFAIRTCSFLTLRSYLEESISFHVVFRTVKDAHSAFALLICSFFILLKFYNRFTKNYPAEVCLISHGVMFKPLSSALHRIIHFLRNPLPAPHSAFLAIGLPA